MKIFSHRKLDELLSDPRIRISGVAKVAGVTVPTVNDIRKGKKKPMFNTVAGIAMALNKPIDYFMEDEALVRQQRLTLPSGKVAAHGLSLIHI